MPSREEVFAQLIAGLITSAVLVPLFLGVAWLFRRLWRAKERRFFGIDTESRGSVRIKLSCIPVKKGGSSGVTEHSVGFHGNAITEAEYQLALDLTQVIQAKPVTSFLHSFAEHLGGSAIEPPVMCEISVSPPRPDSHPVIPDFPRGYAGAHATDVYSTELRHRLEQELGRGGTTILIGSNVYNLLTDFALRVLTEPDNANHVVFYRAEGTGDEWERGVVVRTLNSSQPSMAHFDRLPRKVVVPEQDRYAGTPVHTEYFLIQRLTVSKKNWPAARQGTVFVCAGISANGSAEAVRTLIRTWRKLLDTYGTTDFTQVYSMQYAEDPDGGVREHLPGSPRLHWETGPAPA